MTSKMFRNIMSTFDKNNNSKSIAFDGNNPAKRRLEENTAFPVNFKKRTPVATFPNPENTYRNEGTSSSYYAYSV